MARSRHRSPPGPPCLRCRRRLPFVPAVRLYPGGLCRGASDRAVPAHEIVPDPEPRKHGRLRALDAAARPVAGALGPVEPLVDVVVVVRMLAYSRVAAVRGPAQVVFVRVREVGAVVVRGVARRVCLPKRDLVGIQIVGDELRGYPACARRGAPQQARRVESVLSVPPPTTTSMASMSRVLRSMIPKQ